MDSMFRGGSNNKITYVGNLGNYDQKSYKEAEDNVLLTRNLDSPINLSSNQEDRNEVLRFFGITECPDTEPGQPPVYLYSTGEEDGGGSKTQNESDETLNNTDDANSSEESDNLVGAEAAAATNGELDETHRNDVDLDSTPRADVAGSDDSGVRDSPLNDFYGRPLTPPYYPEGMLLPTYDEIFDTQVISRMFRIDFGAFRPNAAHVTDTEAGDSPQFTLRNRNDIKQFLTHLLTAYNLNEAEMMFNVEVCALILHTILLRNSDKSYILKVVKALLVNDMRTVFKMVDFHDGFESKVTEYKFMNTEDSSSEESDDEVFRQLFD